MARPLRIEYPGALYHVLDRGNQRLEVFQRKCDCETFLDKLSLFIADYNIEIYCYCLMTNHFHLLLRTNESNLGKFMQSFLTSFTVTINRRNGKTGHLFHGRYKALLVENQKYISVLSKYIHLNPVRVKKNKSLPVSEMKRLLDTYPWSSYLATIGLSEPPDFLKTDTILHMWGDKCEDQMTAYRSYVENGLYKEVENPFDLAIRQQIIGSETFAEKIARKYLLKRNPENARDNYELFKAARVLPPEEIVKLTAKAFNTTVEKTLARKDKHMQARKLAMFLCCKYCVSKHPLTEIADLFSVSLSGLTKTRDIVQNGNDQVLMEKAVEVKSAISQG